MFYTVTFNPALDYVVHPGTLTIGEVNRSRGEELYCGGKGINVSAVLAELGIRSRALGFIAGFTGEAIAKGVAEMGIDADFVKLGAGNSRINVKIKSDAETEINCQGPDIPPEAVDALFKKLSVLEPGDTLVLAGSIPSSLPPDIYERILAAVDGRGIVTAVDATGELLKRVLRYRPFVVKPNDRELGELFGRELKTDAEIEECARELQKAGAQNVLVSMAGSGAMLIDSNGITHRVGVCKRTVRNSVGAGDSMLAGFLAGSQSGDYGRALRLGTAAGGATAFSDGLAKRELIFSLLTQLEEQGGN